MRQPTTVRTVLTKRIGGAASEQAAGLLPSYTIGSSGGAGVHQLFNSENWFDKRLTQWAQTILNNQTDGNAPAPSLQTMKFLCHGVRMSHEIKNMSRFSVHVTLYDCVQRIGVPLKEGIGAGYGVGCDPIDQWNQGLSSEQNPQPGFYPYGLARQSATTTPFMSRQFCKAFRIVKVTKKVLGSGDLHKHSVSVKTPKMFDPLENGDGADLVNDTIWPGLSGFTLMTAVGVPVNDATTPTTIGYSGTAVDVITRFTASFSSVTRERKQAVTFDRIATSFPGGARGIAEDVDEIVTDARA